MARARTEPDPVAEEPPVPEAADRAADAEIEAGQRQQIEPEDDLPSSVSADPLRATFDDGRWLLSPAQIEALRAPLDGGSVKLREGKYRYLETFVVIETANRIFGFDNWGHEVVEIASLGQPVQVENKDGSKQGWAVAFRCTVRLTVRGCVPTDGVGFGNGLQYTGDQAILDACELAVKEAESDALKRAFRKFGNQFGLPLYAKDNERAHEITGDSKQQARSGRPAVRQTAAPEVPVPTTWAAIQDLVSKIATGGEETVADFTEYVAQMTERLFGTRDTGKLDAQQKAQVRQKAATTALNLEQAVRRELPPPSRDELGRAFATVVDGEVLVGPKWAIGPVEAGELGLPTRAQWLAAQEGAPAATGGPVSPADGKDGGTDVPAAVEASEATPAPAGAS